MTAALKSKSICRTSFWVVFGAMLVAQFGFSGKAAHAFSTSCAAVIVLFTIFLHSGALTRLRAR